MEENDYMELQTLLLKLRIVALKEIGNQNLISKERDRYIKTIIYVDWLRNNIDIGEIEF